MAALRDPALPELGTSPPRVGVGSSPPARATSLPVPVRQPAIPDPSRPPAPVERRLPAHQGKLARVSDQLAGLGEDLKAWIELRVQLVQTEIQEQIEYRVAQAKQGAAAGLFAALGAFFALVALALGFAWIFLALGMEPVPAVFLGFLVLTLLLFAVAGFLYARLKPTPPPSVRPDRPA